MTAKLSKEEAEVEIDLVCNTPLLHHLNEFGVATFFFFLLFMVLYLSTFESLISPHKKINLYFFLLLQSIV